MPPLKRSALQTIKFIFFLYTIHDKYKRSIGGTLITDFEPCHTLGGYLLDIHHGNPGSIPGQPMWDSWWTKWN